jgi:hypothetical protein
MFTRLLQKWALTTPLCSSSLSTSHLGHLPHRSQLARSTKNLAVRAYKTSNSRTHFLPSEKKPPKPIAGSAIRIRSYANMADYEATLKGKYPAKAHARKVVEYMRSKNKDVTGVLYLEGQKTKMIEDNDGEAPFRYASQYTIGTL